MEPHLSSPLFERIASLERSLDFHFQKSSGRVYLRLVAVAVLVDFGRLLEAARALRREQRLLRGHERRQPVPAQSILNTDSSAFKCERWSL